jgi:taurine dioxygenase
VAGYETISVEPVSPVIGAEISGVDLSQPLGNQTVQEIHDALMAHLVVFFRNQDLTLHQHKAFGRHFGDLHVHPAAPGPEGHPEVISVHADERSKWVVGETWHSDVSCDAEPPMGSILQIHEVPPAGGDTMFANMYAAYEALSEPVRGMLDGLTALHESEATLKSRYGVEGRFRDKDAKYPSAVHPVVRTHPVTGRKALYVNTSYTTKINGLNKRESDALLKMLLDHIATPEFHCRFRWRPKSIAFWDNRAAQHKALWDYHPQVRSGYRVTIAGDKPF